MKPNLLKESSIAVMTKEEKQEEKAKEIQKKEKVGFETKKVTQNQELKTEKPKVNLFSAKTFEDAQDKTEKLNLLSNKQVIEEKPQLTPVIKENLEEKQEEIKEDFVSFTQISKPKKKEWKFRLKVVSVVYAAVILVMAGWVISNAVRINNVNTAISQTQTEISVNTAKYISEIEKIDNQKPDYDNSELIPIDEIITVQPLPLEDVTDYEKESNWFDNIINWFGNLFFGG